MRQPILQPSEREARIQQQKDRLSGLRFRGEEECAHCSYDTALTMLERDTLVYLGPEKFPTRRNELQLKKPGKEITIDQSQLIVKEKPSDFTCFHQHRVRSSKCSSQESPSIRARGDMFIQHHDQLSPQTFSTIYILLRPRATHQSAYNKFSGPTGRLSFSLQSE